MQLCMTQTYAPQSPLKTTIRNRNVQNFLFLYIVTCISSTNITIHLKSILQTHASSNITTISLSDSYFAQKKQRHPKYFNAEFLTLSAWYIQSVYFSQINMIQTLMIKRIFYESVSLSLIMRPMELPNMPQEISNVPA